MLLDSLLIHLSVEMTTGVAKHKFDRVNYTLGRKFI